MVLKSLATELLYRKLQQKKHVFKPIPFSLTLATFKRIKDGNYLNSNGLGFCRAESTRSARLFAIFHAILLKVP